MSQRGWIGVDLDGTLAHYDHWRGVEHIGAPVPAMLARVRAWLRDGIDVRIFTARVCDGQPATQAVIDRWCEEHVGCVLPVTNVKDFGMVELWDDRAVQVAPNTGESVADRNAVQAETIAALLGFVAEKVPGTTWDDFGAWRDGTPATYATRADVAL